MRSSGTPLYPLFPGNSNPALRLDVPFDLHSSIEAIRHGIVDSKLGPLLGLGLLTLVGLVPWSVAGYLLGTFATVVAISATASTVPSSELSRYFAPYLRSLSTLLGVSVAIGALQLLGRFVPRLNRPPHAAVAALLGMIVVLAQGVRMAESPQMGFLRAVWPGLTTASLREPPSPYERAFAAIPAGSKVLAQLGEAYRIDYRHHTIYNIDDIGSAAPPPGIPLEAGKFSKYLTGLGIDYLIYERPEAARRPYSEELMLSQLDSKEPLTSGRARFYTAYYEMLRTLELTSTIVYQDAWTVVLRFPQHLASRH
jgi:hypothetical protein